MQTFYFFINCFISILCVLSENFTEQKANPSSPCNLVTGGIVSMKTDNDEKYEKAVPVHGDLMFHNYLERIQENPGQILR